MAFLCFLMLGIPSARAQNNSLSQAQNLFYQGKFSEAKHSLQLILAQDSTNAEAHNLLAEILQHEHNYAEAEKEYNLAATYNPSSEEIAYARANFFIDRGQAKEAVDLLTKLNEDNPKNFAYVHDLAVALEMLGEKEKALQYFQKPYNRLLIMLWSTIRLAEYTN